jgi:hypothetical protein
MKERYAVDSRRLYVTGLSGGARVASSVALGCKNCVAGVIACGAGLPQGATIPGPEVADWFLVAGTTDFNYPELVHLKDSLDTRGAVSRFVVFDGPHGWMPKEVTERALAWLQLRAMARGLELVDKDFIGSQFESRLAEAQAAQKGGDILAAVRAYQEIAVDFRTFRDVKEQEKLAQSLAGSGEFRKARKSEKAALDLQDEIASKIGNVVAGISQAREDRAAFISQLQSAVYDAYRDQQGSSNPTRKQALARGLASAFAYAAESGQQAMLKKDYLSAKDMFQAGETILPHSAWASYLMATAQAQLGDKKQAIQELKRAMDKGMTNAKALEDSAFDRIRGDEAFREIAQKIASLGNKQP